jgi:SAM-dependent methyltransferase
MISFAPLRRWFDILSQLPVARFLAGTRPPGSADPQQIHPFDRQHRVDTSGLLYAPALVSGHPNDFYSEGYYATAPSLFHAALARWHQTLYSLAIADYTFIDLGCGKGRVLLMASVYPFKAVMGVELNQKLATIAQKNLAKWMRRPRACRNATVFEGDVLEMPIPDGPVVLFLFNSFEAEMVRGLLVRLAESSRTRSAPIDLIYVHPEHDNLARKTPGIERLADETIPLSAQDAAADAFDVTFDQCCVYRLPGRRQ